LLTKIASMTTAAAKGGWTRETRFKVIADRWETDLAHEVTHGTMSAGTQRTYLSFLKNHIRPRLDALMMWEVSAIICDDLIKDTRNAKGYDSAKTVRTILSAICSLAVRLGAIDVNPVRSTARLAKGRSDQKDVKAMDHEQIDDMLTGLDTYAVTKERDSKGRRIGKRVVVWRDLRELSEAMLATGVRIGEVLATSGDDVTKDDEGKPAVNIDAHIVRIKGQGIVRVPGRKGNKPGVLLTLPDWAAPMFARRKLAAGPNGPLFASLDGGWLDSSNTINRLREALNAIGFAWVTSHVWRKTVATLLDETGLNVGEIADQLGNTRAVTEKHYIKRRSRNKKAAGALESIKPTKKAG
jgi:integrase